MSKTSSNKSHSKKRSSDKTVTRSVIPDGGIYIAIAGVGAIGLVFWYGSSPDDWQYGLIGYLIAVAILVNLNAFKACRGHHLSSWQQSIARLPLRCAGYGNKGGKPVEAAKGQKNALMMVFMSMAFSVAVILALSWWLELFR